METRSVLKNIYFWLHIEEEENDDESEEQEEEMKKQSFEKLLS